MFLKYYMQCSCLLSDQLSPVERRLCVSQIIIVVVSSVSIKKFDCTLEVFYQRTRICRRSLLEQKSDTVFLHENRFVILLMENDIWW